MNQLVFLPALMLILAMELGVVLSGNPVPALVKDQPQLLQLKHMRLQLSMHY